MKETNMNLESEMSGMREQAARDQGSKDQTMMTWIIVLAIAITCCAILFVIFANYLSVINKNLAAANTRLTVMESNEAQLLSEIQALHRTMIANQPKTTPPAGSPPSPNAPSAPPPITH
jgi:hypothetical protein